MAWLTLVFWPAEWSLAGITGSLPPVSPPGVVPSPSTLMLKMLMLPPVLAKLTAPSLVTVAVPVWVVFLSAAVKPEAPERLVSASKVTALSPVEAKTMVTVCPFVSEGMVTVTFLPASCRRLALSMRNFFSAAFTCSPSVSASTRLPALTTPLMATLFS